MGLSSAQAQDEQPGAPPCGRVLVNGYEHGAACATPGHETPRTLDDILSDESLSRMVMLHFGPGFLDADLVAYELSINAETPSVAIPGGEINTVRLIIAGRTTNRLLFDQWQLNGGRVGNVAQQLYAHRMEAIRASSHNIQDQGSR